MANAARCQHSAMRIDRMKSSSLEAFDAWLADSTAVPKLLMTFEGAPTLLITSEVAAWCAAHMASLDIVACGQAGHHAPEDQPETIAAAIYGWADRHRLR